MKPTTKQKLPAGWTEKKIRAVIDHYDKQTEDESAAEIESAPDADETLLLVPNALVETVSQLIKEYEKSGHGPSLPRNGRIKTNAAPTKRTASKK